MTLRAAIAKADNLEPNAFTQEDKIRWLAYLDGDIREETILSHERDENSTVPDTEYTTDSLDEDLIAPYPYDEMYPYYILLRMAEANDEMTRYNNLTTQFNGFYNDYLRKYNREHMPLGCSMKYR